MIKLNKGITALVSKLCAAAYMLIYQGKGLRALKHNDEIQNLLFQLKDEEYRRFQSALIPGISYDRVIGVRIPRLRALAKQLIKEGRADKFISELPHYYYEENNLHAFIIAEEKDFHILMEKTEAFLPHIDNWATCDSFRPKAFRLHKKELEPYALRWLESDGEYTVRFAVEVLMTCFLSEDFRDEYPRRISGIISDKYYVNMMIAWYFATALSVRYDEIIVYIEENKLPLWVHNKTISKACESLRITKEQKEYLKTLKK